MRSPKPKEVCERCGGTGYEVVQVKGARCARECRCYVERDVQRRLGRLALRDRDALLDSLEPCTDPKICFATADVQRKAISLLRASPDASFAFFGPAGVAKSTYLAALYHHAVVTQRVGTFFALMSDMMRELRDLEFGQDECPYLSRRVIRETAQSGIRPRVFLDEFDKVKSSDFARNAAHDLIHELYGLVGRGGVGAQLAIATNLSRKEFAETWGSNILRRIEAMAGDGGIFDYFEISQ